MDYYTVAETANIITLITTSLLLMLLAVQCLKERWKRFLLIGVSAQLVWSVVMLTSYYSQDISTLLLYTELLRLALWLTTLFLLLNQRASFATWPSSAKVLAWASVIITIAGFAVISTRSAPASLIRLSFVCLAMLNLIFTEQVVRNLNTHRMIKLLGLCLTFMFAYDVLLFAQGMIVSQLPPILLQGRFALSFALMGVLAVGALVFNHQTDSTYLFTVSRPAAFYSTAFMFSSLLIISIAIGSVYVENNGYLATYLFSLALLMVLFIFFGLLISRTFRQRFEVFLSKHFFSLKYDYRIEWLSTIRTLSDLKTDQSNYYEKVLNVFTSALRSSGGELWLANGARFNPVTRQVLSQVQHDTVSVGDAFIRKMLKEGWIFAPQTRSPSLAQANMLLPDWLADNAGVWVVAPLTIQMNMVGFVLLAPPYIRDDITYEDRDLLTNIGTQVASHILLHEQEKVISSAKQMETYNRLSAFIMHDMNNVIAQLSLIGKNAERHRDNPAFIDDMIKTVNNATSRMQELVQKFNPSTKEKRISMSAQSVIEDVIAQVASFHPVPKLSVTEDFSLDADKQRITLALKNLIRNAQEAAFDDGEVLIEITRKDNTPVISISDSGVGMSEQFISEELFKPFSTTKREGGVGIGAYLTKSYIEHLGAQLSVRSELNVGSTFEIAFY